MSIQPAIYLDEKSTIEYMIEGLKKAASKARELGQAQQKKEWLKVADFLDAVLRKAAILASAKAMQRIDVLAALDQRQKTPTVN